MYMAMGVPARSILLTNSAPAFLEYGKNREIAIEVVKFGATDSEVCHGSTWIGEAKPAPY
jgi:hypothetical protein